MFRTLAPLLEPLLRRLLPAHGTHRATAQHQQPALNVPPSPPEAHPTPVPPPLRGEDTALVRPYLVAHEQRMAREHRQTVLARAEFLLGVAA